MRFMLGIVFVTTVTAISQIPVAAYSRDDDKNAGGQPTAEQAAAQVRAQSGEPGDVDVGAVADVDAEGGKPEEKPFVDRNGDGINDCMEHRFRRGGKGRGKASSGKGGRQFRGGEGDSEQDGVRGVEMPGMGQMNGAGTNGNNPENQGRDSK